MNFEKAFKYPFEDPDWFNKIIFPILISFIPLIGQMVANGWILDLTRNVAAREQRPLPELDFGKQLARGFKGWIVGAVYALPFVLVLMVLSIIIGLGTESGELTVVTAVAFILFFLFFLLTVVALLFLLPAAAAKLAITDSIAEALKVGSIIRMIRNNFKAWLKVAGGTFLASLIAPLGALAFGIGAVFTGLYAQMITAHLSAQAYELSQTQDGIGVTSF